MPYADAKTVGQTIPLIEMQTTRLKMRQSELDSHFHPCVRRPGCLCRCSILWSRWTRNWWWPWYSSCLGRGLCCPPHWPEFHRISCIDRERRWFPAGGKEKQLVCRFFIVFSGIFTSIVCVLDETTVLSFNSSISQYFSTAIMRQKQNWSPAISDVEGPNFNQNIS